MSALLPQALKLSLSLSISSLPADFFGGNVSTGAADDLSFMHPSLFIGKKAPHICIRAKLKLLSHCPAPTWEILKAWLLYCYQKPTNRTRQFRKLEQASQRQTSLQLLNSCRCFLACGTMSWILIKHSWGHWPVSITPPPPLPNVLKEPGLHCAPLILFCLHCQQGEIAEMSLLCFFWTFSMEGSFVLSLSRLRGALKADLLSAAGSAAILGVVLHISVFWNIKVELYLYSFLGLYLAAMLGIGYMYLSLIEFSIIESLTRVLLLAASFNAGLILSIAIYWLFFHCLHCFPGLFGAKLSRFYSTSLAAKNFQYYWEVAKMHEKYGDFIWTGKCHDFSVLKRINDHVLRPLWNLHCPKVSHISHLWSTVRMSQVNLVYPGRQRLQKMLGPHDTWLWWPQEEKEGLG